MGSYLSHLYRRNPEAAEPGKRPEGLPRGFIQKAALSAAGFASLNVALPYILPRLIPGFDQLDSKTQRQFVYYVSSLCHHLVVAPWSFALIFQQWRASATASSDTMIDYTGSLRGLAPFTSGYFLTDFLFTLRDAGAQPECESCCIV